ncbi:MAG: hypothetical protein HW418_3553, partial [Anaerolineales bacterium]|nr:hypothetical protein [Anaerolineales bacterium]
PGRAGDRRRACTQSALTPFRLAVSRAGRTVPVRVGRGQASMSLSTARDLPGLAELAQSGAERGADPAGLDACNISHENGRVGPHSHRNCRCGTPTDRARASSRRWRNAAGRNRLDGQDGLRHIQHFAGGRVAIYSTLRTESQTQAEGGCFKQNSQGNSSRVTGPGKAVVAPALAPSSRRRDLPADGPPRLSGSPRGSPARVRTGSSRAPDLRAR